MNNTKIKLIKSININYRYQDYKEIKLNIILIG